MPSKNFHYCFTKKWLFRLWYFDTAYCCFGHDMPALCKDAVKFRLANYLQATINEL